MRVGAERTNWCIRGREVRMRREVTQQAKALRKGRDQNRCSEPCEDPNSGRSALLGTSCGSFQLWFFPASAGSFPFSASSARKSELGHWPVGFLEVVVQVLLSTVSSCRSLPVPPRTLQESAGKKLRRMRKRILREWTI